MNIKQIIVNDDIVLIFTDNPRDDVKVLIEKYKNKTSKVHLGYELPFITSFRFLEKEYECIGLWFDNEDVPEFYKQYKDK